MSIEKSNTDNPFHMAIRRSNSTFVNISTNARYNCVALVSEQAALKHFPVYKRHRSMGIGMNNKDYKMEVDIEAEYIDQVLTMAEGDGEFYAFPEVYQIFDYFECKYADPCEAAKAYIKDSDYSNIAAFIELEDTGSWSDRYKEFHNKCSSILLEFLWENIIICKKKLIDVLPEYQECLIKLFELHRNDPRLKRIFQKILYRCSIKRKETENATIFLMSLATLVNPFCVDTCDLMFIPYGDFSNEAKKKLVLEKSPRFTEQNFCKLLVGSDNLIILTNQIIPNQPQFTEEESINLMEIYGIREEL